MIETLDEAREKMHHTRALRRSRAVLSAKFLTPNYLALLPSWLEEQRAVPERPDGWLWDMKRSWRVPVHRPMRFTELDPNTISKPVVTPTQFQHSARIEIATQGDDDNEALEIFTAGLVRIERVLEEMRGER